MRTAPNEAALPNDPNVRGDVSIDERVAGREALVRGNLSFHDVTETVCKVNELPVAKTPNAFKFGIALGGAGFAMFGGYVGYLFWNGPGIWGNNNPVGWAWDIVNFVFWVGIGHAGTLISAVLFLFRQKWRTSINRASEAMTIFAVICALPEILIANYAMPFYFGGTSLLIVVSVTMDTVAQIHSHLLAHQYEGLLKKSKLKGRRG